MKSEPSRAILITGATGAIGGALAEIYAAHPVSPVIKMMTIEKTKILFKGWKN